MIEALIAEMQRLKRNIYCSWQGWAAAWAHEKSLRQWAGLNALSILLALGLGLSSVERALVIGFGLLVLVAELVNTSVEDAVNRISVERHPLSKKAKDTASAAVVVTALAAGLVWTIILLG